MSNAVSANPNVIYDREDEARSRMLRHWGLDRPRPSADVVALNAKRRPLGLAPILDGAADDRDASSFDYLGPQATAAKIVADSLANLPEEAWAAPATMKDLWEYGIGIALETSFDVGDTLRQRIREVRKEIADAQAERRNEVAELKLTITESRCELREMRAIQENARIVSRGEQGIAGPRGVPGPPGEGRVGPAGPSGRDAVAVVAWDVDAERFVITPCYSDGTRGVPLNLRGLFEAYNAATDADDE